MPMAPPRHCPKPGHPTFTGRRCPECARARRDAFETKRPSARARGYSPAWDKASKAFLALPGNRTCACGCGREADVVDHVTAHKGDMRLFWDQSNWQPMARACNSRKAVRHEGALQRQRGGRL